MNNEDVKFLVDKKALDKVFMYLQNRPYIEVVDIIKTLSESITKNVEEQEKARLESEDIANQE